MSDNWDSETFEPEGFATAGAAIGTLKWEGEDEDEDVKESWEDFDEEENNAGKDKDSETTAEEVRATTVKKKKNLKVSIAAKEEQLKKENEEKNQERLEQEENSMTPEEHIAEKERQRRLQEESDLELAKEAFGVNNESEKFGLEAMTPANKEDFDTFRKALVETMTKHERSSYYLTFVDELFRELCLNMEAEEVKKLGNTLHLLANEKVKAAKALKGKKKAGKSKVSLVVGRPNDYDYGGGYEANEFDDFM